MVCKTWVVSVALACPARSETVAINTLTLESSRLAPLGLRTLEVMGISKDQILDQNYQLSSTLCLDDQLNVILIQRLEQN
jgi:hypothetical protein